MVAILAGCANLQSLSLGGADHYPLQHMVAMSHLHVRLVHLTLFDFDFQSDGYKSNGSDYLPAETSHQGAFFFFFVFFCFFLTHTE